MSASKQKNEKLSSNPMGAASLAVLYNVWGEGGESENLHTSGASAPRRFATNEDMDDHMSNDRRLDQ